MYNNSRSYHYVDTRPVMDSIIHFIKHLLGICGEPHPSLLFGGMGIISYCIYCIKVAKNKFTNKSNTDDK